MSLYPQDYVEYVLEDIEKNKKQCTPANAGFFERYCRRHLSPEQMHPNPDDEFSKPEVGPNFEIIGKYVRIADSLSSSPNDIFEEPVVVEKITPGGYMLLNGHHRWFAARRLGLKKMRVEITNLTHTEQIRSVLDQTTHIKRAAFDLDEVLMAGAGGSSAEPVRHWISGRFLHERLRIGTVRLIRKLQENGYDIWVYTESYKSRQYIHSIFRLYGLSICGCINAAKRIKPAGEKKNRTKELFNSQYKVSVNIDTETVLIVNDTNHNFDQYALNYKDADSWADSVIRILDEKLPK